MSSNYNLKQKMLNVALADEMLRNPPVRINHKTNQPEQYRYPLEHVKKITKLNRADIKGLIDAIIEEQEENATSKV